MAYGNLQFVGDFSQLTFEPMEVLYGPKGCCTRFKVTSPNIAALKSYYNYIITFGASGTFLGLDYGATRELAVEFPGLPSNLTGINEWYPDQWELLTNESADTIFANPILVGGASPLLDYNEKTVLSRLTRDGGTITDAVASCNSDVDAGTLVAPTVEQGGTINGSTGESEFGAPSAPVARQVMREILKGQTEYGRPTLVLRHTSYCSAGATYNAAIINAMKIYSPGHLLSEVGTGWTYNLPARLYSKIAGTPTQFAPEDEAAYYTWGWLKKITREPVLANFMVEVSTEYELALWSNLRYESAG